MKKFLCLFLCILLLAVSIVPVSAVEPWYPPMGSYEFVEGYSMNTYIRYPSSGGGALIDEHLYANLHTRSDNITRYAYIVCTDLGTEPFYLYITKTNVFNLNYSTYTMYEAEEYVYDEEAGVWLFLSNRPSLTYTKTGVFKWASDDFITQNGYSVIDGDPNFHPVPLAEMILGVAEEQMEEEALPTLAETIMVIVMIAIGMMALLVSLMICFKVFRHLVPIL